MTAVSQWITTTLCLRSEEDINLLYVVEVEEGDQVYRCFSTENYYQALVVAKRVFNKLKTRQNIGDFGVLIEAPQGRGVTYDINAFSYEPDFNDSSKFYEELVNDLEYQLADENKNINLLFREAVNRHRLNEYQEQKLLQKLKECRSEKR